MNLTIQKNDKKAYLLIGIFSVIVFAAVVFLSRFTIAIDLGFDKHVFAKINAVLEESTLQTPELEYFQKGGKQGIHSEHMGYILTEMQFMQRTYPNMNW